METIGVIGVISFLLSWSSVRALFFGFRVCSFGLGCSLMAGTRSPFSWNSVHGLRGKQTCLI